MKAFLPEQTRISQVHLRTAKLEGAVAFYTDVLGLKLLRAPGSQAILSATGEAPGLLELTEDLNAPLRPPRSSGLYHFAIRYPARLDLAHALERLLRSEYPIQGGSDHQVSEAIYLSDPDDNGVELYVDRPRSQWIWRNAQVAMTTEPLDFESLLASTEGQPAPSNIPPQTDLGHIHLHVADLTAAERFYHEFLGLAVTQRSYPGALFFSAGGYHHHLAVNTWAGDQPPPDNSIGLISYRLEVPEAEILYCLRNRAPLAGYHARTETRKDASEVVQIRDPNGNWLEVHSPSSPRLTPVGRKHAQLLTRN